MKETTDLLGFYSNLWYELEWDVLERIFLSFFFSEKNSLDNILLWSSSSNLFFLISLTL